jgi:hypothetical protein
LNVFDEFQDDRPEPLKDEPDQKFDPTIFGEGFRGIGAAIGIAVFLLPVALMVGVMRWNIASTLDADLKWIFTRFCDTVLIFCIALPLCPLLPGEWGGKLSSRVFKGLFRLLWVAKWIGILVFVAASLASFAYIFWMIWKLVTG